ncbi:MAG: hypothetical protein M3N10_04660 [Actinomycetota bacterium]|nr:hypothetical protein [Actinomycetota bacterium]
MQSSDLVRWGGLAALVSAAVSVIGDILRLFVDVESAGSATGTSYALVFGLHLIGSVLLLLGLVGLYVSQSEAAGVLGLVGFLVAFAGTALLVGALWFELFITPALAAEAPELAEAELGLAGFILVLLTGALGWVLFGAATLRARVYPRGAAVLLIVGGLVAFAPVPLAGIIFSGAVAWMGFILFTGRVVSSEEPARVS